MGMQHVLGMGSSRSWIHTPNSPFQTAPDPSVKARSQTHLIEDKRLGKAGACGTASLAVGEPGGVVSQLPAARLKTTTSSCTTCSELSPAGLCSCFLLGGCSPPACCLPVLFLPRAAPPGSGMLPEHSGGVGGPGGADRDSTGWALSPPHLTRAFPACTGGAVGRRGQQWPGRSPAVTGQADALSHGSKLSPPCSPRALLHLSALPESSSHCCSASDFK